jgi:hypothetical protein
MRAYMSSDTLVFVYRVPHVRVVYLIVLQILSCIYVDACAHVIRCSDRIHSFVKSCIKCVYTHSRMHRCHRVQNGGGGELISL